MNNQDPPGYLAPCCPEQRSDKERKFEAKPLIKCTIYMNNYFDYKSIIQRLELHAY